MSGREYKSRNFILYLTLNSNLGAFNNGFNYVIFNACLYQVLATINTDGLGFNLDKALMSSSIPFGGIFGALIASQTVSSYGRRKTMILADIVIFLGAFLSIADSMLVMLLGRILCGLSSGLNYLTIPLYVREMSPPELSGRTGGGYRLGFSIGVFVAFFMSFGLENPPVGSDWWWRFMYITPCFMAILRTVGFFMFADFETPRFYLFNFDEYNAIESITKLYNRNYVQKVYEREKTVERVVKLADVWGHQYIK